MYTDLENENILIILGSILHDFEANCFPESSICVVSIELESSPGDINSFLLACLLSKTDRNALTVNYGIV